MTHVPAPVPAVQATEILIAQRENSRRALSLVFSVCGIIFQAPFVALTVYALLGGAPDAMFLGAMYFFLAWPFLGAGTITAAILAFRLRRSPVAKVSAIVSLALWTILMVAYWGMDILRAILLPVFA